MQRRSSCQWLEQLFLELFESMVVSVGVGKGNYGPAFVELCRPDGVATLGKSAKKNLQRAQKGNATDALVCLERIAKEFGYETPDSYRSIMRSAMEDSGGSKQPRLLVTILRMIENLADSLDDRGTRREQLAFGRYCLEASLPAEGIMFGVDKIVASLATGMGLVGDPLDCGPTKLWTPINSYGFDWLPKKDEDGIGFVPSRYLVLQAAYTARAAALGAPNPADSWHQAIAIGEAIDMDAESVRKRINRQRGPKVLTHYRQAKISGVECPVGTRRPISGDLIGSDLALDCPRWHRHFWTATVDLVDYLQRSLLANGVAAEEIIRCFERYPVARTSHDKASEEFSLAASHDPDKYLH